MHEVYFLNNNPFFLSFLKSTDSFLQRYITQIWEQSKSVKCKGALLVSEKKIWQLVCNLKLFLVTNIVFTPLAATCHLAWLRLDTWSVCLSGRISAWEKPQVEMYRMFQMWKHLVKQIAGVWHILLHWNNTTQQTRVSHDTRWSEDGWKLRYLMMWLWFVHIPPALCSDSRKRNVWEEEEKGCVWLSSQFHLCKSFAISAYFATCKRVKVHVLK